MTHLSPHFTLAELTVTDHREFDNSPTQEEISNLQRLAQLLEQVKEAIGGKPVMINSAFRCKQVNDAVGSKDTSQHRHGCAADLRVPGMTPDQVVRAVIAAGLPYQQLIREFDRWTHISITNEENAEPKRQVLIIDKTGTRQFA
jgi:predicted DNA binding CopG/RHH family protein